MDAKRLAKDLAKGAIDSANDYFAVKAAKKTAKNDQELKVLELARQIRKDEFDKQQQNIVNTKNLFTGIATAYNTTIQKNKSQRDLLITQHAHDKANKLSQYVKEFRDSGELLIEAPPHSIDPENPKYTELVAAHDNAHKARVRFALNLAAAGEPEMLKDMVKDSRSDAASLMKDRIEQYQELLARNAYEEYLDNYRHPTTGQPLSPEQKKLNMGAYDAKMITKGGHYDQTKPPTAGSQLVQTPEEIIAEDKQWLNYIDKYVPEDLKLVAIDTYALYQTNRTKANQDQVFKTLRGFGALPTAGGARKPTETEQDALQKAIAGISNEDARNKAQGLYDSGYFTKAADYLASIGKTEFQVSQRKDQLYTTGVEAASKGLLTASIKDRVYSILPKPVGSEQRNQYRNINTFRALADFIERAGITIEDAIDSNPTYLKVASQGLDMLSNDHLYIYDPQSRPFFAIPTFQLRNKSTVTQSQMDAENELWDRTLEGLKLPGQTEADLTLPENQKTLIQAAFTSGYGKMDNLNKTDYSLNQLLATHLPDLIDEARELQSGRVDPNFKGFGRIQHIGREFAKLKDGSYPGDAFIAWNTKLRNVRNAYQKIRFGLTLTQHEIKSLDWVLPTGSGTEQGIIVALETTLGHANADLDAIVRRHILPDNLIPTIPEGLGEFPDQKQERLKWRHNEGEMFSWGAYEYALNNFDANPSIFHTKTALAKRQEQRRRFIQTGQLIIERDKEGNLIDRREVLKNTLTVESKFYDPAENYVSTDYLFMAGLTDVELINWAQDELNRQLERGSKVGRVERVLRSFPAFKDYVPIGDPRFQELLSYYTEMYNEKYGGK